MASRQVFRQVTEVPFPDDAGSVSRVSERLGYGDFFRGETGPRVGEEHTLLTPVHAASEVHPSRQQGRTAWRADGCLRVETRPTLALVRHPIEMWGADVRVAVGAEVPVAQVIGGNDDDVRSPHDVLGSGGRGRPG